MMQILHPRQLHSRQEVTGWAKGAGRDARLPGSRERRLPEDKALLAASWTDVPLAWEQLPPRPAAVPWPLGAVFLIAHSSADCKYLAGFLLLWEPDKS